MWGIGDLTDPYYEYAVLRHRMYARHNGDGARVGLSHWALMLSIYSFIAIGLCVMFFLTHLHISCGPLTSLVGLALVAALGLQCVRDVRGLYRRCRYGLFLPIKQIGLSSEGIRLLSFFMSSSERAFFRWEDISEIRIGSSQFLDMNVDSEFIHAHAINTGKPKVETCIEIRDVCNKVARLRLSAIRSIEERRVLVEMIKKYARRAADKDDIAQILRVNQIQDIAFTQLWSNALKSNMPRLIDAALQPSSLLQDGRFYVKEQIGGGGQGAIYVAEMTDSSSEPRTVALKEYVLPDQEHVFDRKRAIDQFEREVHLLARLDHESIIKPIDAFVEDHRAYLVMDLVSGDTIKDRVKRQGRFSPDETVQIALKLCDVLKYLHDAKPQVVHLDVTPDNVICGDNYKVTLVDFNTSSDGSGLRTKLIAGKQKYMSPEQFRNDVSPLCDIYALGCTMYFMLTGCEPSPLTRCIVESERNDVMPELSRCIAAATELEGLQRTQSVGEIENVLKSLARVAT
jgi:tRNA A-37 threonylcarbamoyl transferase component Bud32